ncbi:uncharacterized protein F5891DRAFT_1058266 [Suillus fuscotomentosus]|uniref:Uncharacterized protein n=1 Tax=Suillus fuscotomentosus TaxID=1912939 RepID=A0AAD4DWZ8_9AGAM|nr:uncharacterized protein F5891DRAFT_1058266 [Suillus fuscotomentosus]KAG1895415.1 hypothetical protein F5891DRAFT_1058266 [Suillus fuscotomentosus]
MSTDWRMQKSASAASAHLAVASFTLVVLIFYGCIVTPNPTDVQWLFITNFVLAFLIMELCQCVVTLRIWHLFHRSRFIRGLAVTVLIASATGVVIAGVAAFKHIQAAVYGLYNPLNLEENPATLFVIYLPALVVHTTMISLTIYRFGITPTALPRRGIVHRFLKEGMFMYVFAAGEYISILLVLHTLRQITGTLLIAVAATVISVCRAMLSIRSLAATCHVDPAWLLNHAELSRVHWRRGTSEGEIVVEVNEMDVVLPCRSLPSTSVEMEYPGKV